MLTKLMFYFDLWGFCTEYTQSVARKTLSRVIFIVQCVFLVFVVIFTIYENMFDDSFKTQVVLANEAMKTYTALLTYWLIVTESFVSRKAQHKYWTTFNQIQQLQNNPELKLRTFTLLYALSIFWTLFSCGSFVWLQYEAGWQFLAITAIAVMQTQMYQNRIQFYSLYLNIVHEHLGFVLRELDGASYRDNEDLRMFRINYVLIVESVDCVNYIFGWSNAVNILFSFHMLLSQINWFIEIVPTSPISTGIGKKNVYHSLKKFFSLFINDNY